MPSDIDLRGLVGAHILDQGPRPTCVTFATSTAHEALVSLGGAASEHLAPEALWWHATHAGLTSADGMALHDVATALAGPGQPELARWPYNASLGSRTEEPPGNQPGPPWHQARLKPVPLSHDGIERPIEVALAGSRPVVLIIEVTDEFYEPDDEGVVVVPDIRVTAGGYHAVACVGAATHPSRGRMLLIKNSWGPSWGLGGYAWLPVGYLIAFAAQAALVLPAKGA
ncbi:MAG: hypothetical protein IE923_03170 [Micrococcales bacterium]|nr:hypothetical protein [Micrococcales bacterium]